MTDQIRQYARCKVCGEVMVRLPGWRHGDGQVDSDERPVWLLADEQDVPDSTDLPVVVCGCND